MKIRTFIGLGGALVSSCVFAGTMGEIKQYNWARVVTLSLGPVWASAGQTQTLFLTPQIEKTYTVAKETNTLVQGELFYGWQKPVNPVFLGQIGLAIVGAGNAKIAGEIWDDADPTFNNYIYSYKVNHAHIAVKGKLLADMNQMFMPYVSASAGIGINHAYDFNNTPTLFEALPNANFGSNSKTAFAYTLGVGVQKALSQSWQIGVGYEFADWGKSELGLAAEQTIDNGLALNHLYTNGVLFQLSYLG